jgi:hypothetical protein
MAGSRAASAREPGQIREEAALSDTARAPRISLAGAEDLRARPRTSFKGGCTVRFLVGPDRPEQTSWHGHDGIRQNMEQWRSVWESSEMEVDSLESYGDRVLASGAWALVDG